MESLSVNFHADAKTSAFTGHKPSVVKLGESLLAADVTIFLPDGVDAQPIVDAFNIAMKSTKIAMKSTKKVAA